MNQPIILTDDDTPLFLTFTFKGPLNSDARLTVDFKPMLRSLQREIHEKCPNYTDAEREEAAANLGIEEAVFREQWASHRRVFENDALREMTSLLQEVIPDTVTDILDALLPICRFKAITATNNSPKFRSAPVVATSYRTSGVTKYVWDQVQKKLNDRLGIQPGSSLDVEGFWMEMITAWRKLSSPLAHLNRLTQEDFSEALGVSEQALRNRITRNLQTDWAGFKQELKRRLTAT